MVVINVRKQFLPDQWAALDHLLGLEPINFWINCVAWAVIVQIQVLTINICSLLSLCLVSFPLLSCARSCNFFFNYLPVSKQLIL